MALSFGYQRGGSTQWRAIGRALWGAGALGLALLSGCTTFRSGGAPPPTATYGDDLKGLEAIEGKDAMLATFQQNPTEAQRNAYIAANLHLIDLRFSKFLQDSSAQRQAIDTVTDFIQMSLGVAGTGFTSSTAKTVLAAGTATVAGTKTTIDKNYYYQKTESALIASMNAARKQALIPLLKGLKSRLADYGIGQAVVDLHQYYYAGTFLGALEAVQLNAAQSETSANAEIGFVHAATSAQIADKAALTAAIGRLDAAHAANGALAIVALQDMRSEKYKSSPIPAATDLKQIIDQLQDIVRHTAPEQLQAVSDEFKKEGLL